MPTFKSELNSIIAQIRSGNNDPELLASALQVIADNPPYGAGYKEFVAKVSSNGALAPTVQVLKNDFGQNPSVARNSAGVYTLAFNLLVNFNPSNTFADVLGAGALQVETAQDLYVAQAYVSTSNELVLQSWYYDPETLTFEPQDNFGSLFPTIIRIRKYD